VKLSDVHQLLAILLVLTYKSIVLVINNRLVISVSCNYRLIRILGKSPNRSVRA